MRRDFDALERFYPDDYLVTNPNNRVVNKAQFMELIRQDVISYSSFERQFDHVRVYGDTVVVVGSETVVYLPDAKTRDAGKTIQRRVNRGVGATRRHVEDRRPARKQHHTAMMNDRRRSCLPAVREAAMMASAGRRTPQWSGSLARLRSPRPVNVGVRRTGGRSNRGRQRHGLERMMRQRLAPGAPERRTAQCT